MNRRVLGWTAAILRGRQSRATVFSFFVVLADANNLEWCDRVKNKKAGVFPAQLLTCLLIVQIWSVFLG